MLLSSSFRILIAILLLSGAAFVAQSQSQSQSPHSYPAFTLVTEITDYDQRGNPTSVATQTRYESSSGDWRSTIIGPNNRSHTTIYIQQRGVFFADEINRQLVKMSDCVIANCLPHAVTAEALRSDPKFVRTEQLLGVTAYVQKTPRELTYIVPELGDTPFKRITLINGYRRVEEPVKLTLREPDAADLRGPNYPLIDERAVFDQHLESRIIEKPSLQIQSPEISLSKPALVTVEVSVDASGNVVEAWCTGDFAFSRLGRAAEDAAYNTRLTPKEVGEKRVRSMGLIRYSASPN